MKLTYIYYIKNKLNGKVYIGVSDDLDKRWKEHREYSSNKHLRNAIKKYGLTHFEFGQIEELESREEGLKAEIKWIKFLWVFNVKLYNFTDGGESGGDTYGPIEW